MARNTSKELRNKIMYSIFVRNYSKEGTFAAVESDLDRIKSLGVDIIWLMPIHPIGKVGRKGTLGSPYAISDYRGINEEYGTMDDFISLVDAIHASEMKCIIDVVYNHTSPDSWLAVNHPEWFYHKADGSFGNRIGDWTDVIDLDYSNRELWNYQVETLQYWAKYVDGFRCDVAPMVPVDFWIYARNEVAKVNPDAIWLAESGEPRFITYLRSQGIDGASDSEMYEAFDICYDYDVMPYLDGYLSGECTLREYLDRINMEEYILPDNYVKIRCLENHDRTRIAYMVRDDEKYMNLLAFNYFLKGMTFIYNGQEVRQPHFTSLFHKDDIEWNEELDVSDYMRKFAFIKQREIFRNSTFAANAVGDDIIVATHEKEGKGVLGIFNLSGKEAIIPVDLAEGRYLDLISEEYVEVDRSKVYVADEPLILEYDRSVTFEATH